MNFKLLVSIAFFCFSFCYSNSQEAGVFNRKKFVKKIKLT